MGRIVLSMQVSLDGFTEGPQGEFDWPIIEEEILEYFNDEMGAVDSFLYGRRVYEGMTAFWPTADENSAITSPQMQEYARIWRPKPKVVFSDTLERADWDTRVVRSEQLEATAAELRAEPDATHLLYGGADLAATFQRLDLLDEYWLFVQPVLLGGGTRFFSALDARQALVLVEHRTFFGGVMHLRYRRPGSRG